MKLNPRWGAVLAATLALAACREPVRPPEVKLNPSPEERYEITLTVEDPPAAIQRVRGEVQFDIEGVYDDCMPVAERIVGIKPKSSYSVPVVFVRKADGSYAGQVFADWPMDEDYYGLGMCKWSLTGVIAKIHLGSASQAAVIRREQVFGQSSQRNLCLRDTSTSFGCRTPVDGSREEDMGNRFIATMTSRKVNP